MSLFEYLKQILAGVRANGATLMRIEKAQQELYDAMIARFNSLELLLASIDQRLAAAEGSLARIKSVDALILKIRNSSSRNSRASRTRETNSTIEKEKSHARNKNTPSRHFQNSVLLHGIRR